MFEGTCIFLRLGNLSFIKPVYKKVTYFGLNSLRQKGKQILVKNWIFDDSIHFLGTSIGLSCQKSIGRLACHDHINKLIKQALGSAEITSRLEPKGTSIQDRKRPDGISYFPFKNGRCLAWDYTCPDTLACTHIKKSTSTEAGRAAAPQ